MFFDKNVYRRIKVKDYFSSFWISSSLWSSGCWCSWGGVRVCIINRVNSISIHLFGSIVVEKSSQNWRKSFSEILTWSSWSNSIKINWTLNKVAINSSKEHVKQSWEWIGSCRELGGESGWIASSEAISQFNKHSTGISNRWEPVSTTESFEGCNERFNISSSVIDWVVAISWCVSWVFLETKSIPSH